MGWEKSPHEEMGGGGKGDGVMYREWNGMDLGLVRVFVFVGES